MGALGSKLRTLQGGRIAFWCPGCNSAHQVGVDAPTGPNWSFNGDGDKPTLTPSILVRGIRFKCDDAAVNQIIDSYKLPEEREAMLADQRINTVCHSFVTDGRIQFLGDCTHSLAGHTMDLPDFSLDENETQ